ncbi:hypothetical protein [Antarctobacter sp.]|uniref:hypothetical protein n=1 Tax=Antarctobacter sp. TaxID=1872577 RepID=UPI002B2677D3|nr:hypothetical protein [Antarctobacter sp.]
MRVGRSRACGAYRPAHHPLGVALMTGAGLMSTGAAAMADEAADARAAEQWFRAATNVCLNSMERGETVQDVLPGYRVVKADGALVATLPGSSVGFYVLHRGDMHEAADEAGRYRMYCNVHSMDRPLGEMDYVLEHWAEGAVASGRYAATETDKDAFALISTFKTARGCRLAVTYGVDGDAGETAFTVTEVAGDGCGRAAINW